MVLNITFYSLFRSSEPSVRAELMEQLPSVCMVLADLRMASEAVPNYILPVIVRYLTDQNNQVCIISCEFSLFNIDTAFQCSRLKFFELPSAL